jgi:hypothetical protein
MVMHASFSTTAHPASVQQAVDNACGMQRVRRKLCWTSCECWHRWCPRACTVHLHGGVIVKLSFPRLCDLQVKPYLWHHLWRYPPPDRCVPSPSLLFTGQASIGCWILSWLASLLPRWLCFVDVLHVGGDIKSNVKMVLPLLLPFPL